MAAGWGAWLDDGLNPGERIVRVGFLSDHPIEGFWISKAVDSRKERGFMLRAPRAACLFATLFVLTHSFLSATHRSVQPERPLSLAQVWNLNAKYNDPGHGVAFEHPAVWNMDTQFGYIPPVLTQSDKAKPIAGFVYSEGGFPRQRVVGPYSRTNLEGVGIVYSAISAASAEACKTKAASIAGTHSSSQTTLAGLSFTIYPTEGTAMSQSISGKLYAGFAGGTCYLFETGLAVVDVSPGVMEELQPLSFKQIQDIQKRLLDIIHSVRIRTE